MLLSRLIHKHKGAMMQAGGTVLPLHALHFAAALVAVHSLVGGF